MSASRSRFAPRSVSRELDWHDVCAIDEVVPGTGLPVVVKGEHVAVVRTRGGLLAALSNYDPFSHAFVIARGTVSVRAGVPSIASPIYTQSFSLETGACLEDERVHLPVFPVRVQEGRVQVALPSGEDERLRPAGNTPGQRAGDSGAEPFDQPPIEQNGQRKI